jgi:hypothetical protein
MIPLNTENSTISEVILYDGFLFPSVYCGTNIKRVSYDQYSVQIYFNDGSFVFFNGKFKVDVKKLYNKN